MINVTNTVVNTASNINPALLGMDVNKLNNLTIQEDINFDEQNIPDAERLLDQVLPKEGKRCLVLMKNGTVKAQLFYDSNAELLEMADGKAEAGFDVYLACATYDDKGNRKAENVIAANALWLDIDVGKEDGHQTKGDALTALDGFCKSTGLPMPTIIGSGNGFHVYWPLTESISPKEWVATTKAFKKLTGAYGLADPTRTADIASILRLPKTINWKDRENPKDVTVHSWGKSVSTEWFMKRIAELSSAYSVSPLSVQINAGTAVIKNTPTVISKSLPKLNSAQAQQLIALLPIMSNTNMDRGLWVNFCKAIYAMCRDSLGDEIVQKALLNFTARWELGAGRSEEEHRTALLKVLSETTLPSEISLEEIAKIMRARGVSQSTLPDIVANKPQLVLTDNIASNTDELETKLIESNAPVYQRGGILMTVGCQKFRQRDGSEAELAQLKPLETTNIVDIAARHLHVVKKNGQDIKETRLPPHIANTLLDRSQWACPSIASVINAPVIRPDGTILKDVGYDHQTGLYYMEDKRFQFMDTGTANGDIREQALAELQKLKDLLREYKFVSPEARSVALALLLSPAALHAGVRMPLFVIDGSGPGVGKGLLVDSACLIATGVKALTVSMDCSDEELRKHVDGLLLTGTPIINFDNIDRPVEGAYLCSLCTQDNVSVRPLGGSKTVKIEPRVLLVGTGNNVVVSADMTRRTLICRIDPQIERPELTSYPFNPADIALNQRGELHTAILKILSLHALSGYAGEKLLKTDYGSFREWSKVVRGALVWLGEADPLLTINNLREADPVRSSLSQVIIAIKESIGIGTEFTVRELVEFAASVIDKPFKGGKQVSPDAVLALKNALLDIMLEKKPHSTRGQIDTGIIGKYIQSHRDRIVDGLRIATAQVSKKKGNIYCIQSVGT